MGGIIISMKRILLSIITVLAVVFSFSSTAMAANQRCLFTDAELEQAFNTIFSKETNSIISNSVDFDRYGTQVVELGSGLTYIYVNEKIASTRSKVSDTMTSIFKLNKQTVATMRLACTFTYNGSTVSIIASDYRASAEGIPDWTCTAEASHSTASNGYVYVSATYTLYHNGNYNANNFMDMSCNKKGTITKHYP